MLSVNKLFFCTIFILSAQASVNNTQQSPTREQRTIQMPNTQHKPTNRPNINQHRVIANPHARRRLDFNINTNQPKA